MGHPMCGPAVGWVTWTTPPRCCDTLVCMTNSHASDFFISYSNRDARWAEWIAWQAEAGGYSVIYQGWDFRPGSNFALNMHRGVEQSQRVILVLSPQSLSSKFVQPEWAAMFVDDPTGTKNLLVPVRVEECDPCGMLKAIQYIDLVGCDEDEAKNKLLDGLRAGRVKPNSKPPFPNSDKPVFPGVGRERVESPEPVTQLVTSRAQQPGIFPAGRRLGIDLGTNNIRIFMEGAGLVLDEPSVVAIKNPSGLPMAAGSEALDLLSHGNAYALVRPVDDSVIADPELAAEMLSLFLRKLHIETPANAVFSVPTIATKANRKVLADAARQSGIPEVSFVETSLAALSGAGWSLGSQASKLVVTIGAGSTDLALACRTRVTVGSFLRVSGNQMNHMIRLFLKRKYNLLIGDATAERIKLELGSADPLDQPLEMRVKGVNLINRQPHAITLDDSEIREALADEVGNLVAGIKQALEDSAVYLCDDTDDVVILLAGGGANLRLLGKRLEEETGFRASVVGDPSCVVRGLGRFIGGEWKLVEQLRS